MKRPLTTAVVSLAMLAAAIPSAKCEENKPPIDPSANVNQNTESWGLTFAPIPEVLRAHCRALQGGRGLLVDQVTIASPAARIGLQTNDVILQADGQPMTSVNELPPPSEVAELSLLRDGRVRSSAWMPPTNPRRSAGPSTRINGIQSQNWSMPGQRFPTMVQRPGRMPRAATSIPRGLPSSYRSTTSVSATSIARGNESVSISQTGDQISLELFNPRLDDKPIRFRGSRKQIEEQLQSSDLTEAARRQVLQALGPAE